MATRARRGHIPISPAPGLARVWAKAGADPRVPAPGQVKTVAMLGSYDPVARQLVVQTSRSKRSSDFLAHIEHLDRLYGPRPGQPVKLKRPPILGRGA